MNLYTIGFTKISARDFFTRLASNSVARIVDVRLNNVSQLSGFAKRNDLEYFAQSLLNAEYLHEQRLAPTPEILDKYRKGGASWSWYEEEYLTLLQGRKVTWEQLGLRDGDCLLCSEPTARKCHRRLAAEFLAATSADIRISHL